MKRLACYFLTVLILLSTAVVSCAPASVPIQDPIKIDTGQISGETVGALHVYKGIPFAAPPVGDMRWKSPQPAASWQGVKECTKFSPAPAAYFTASFPAYSKPPSEDCLYLNVWTPAKTTGDKLPVMVWIYGGAYIFGEGSNPQYDGTNLANRGVIVVTFNYRLGPFGFLAHPLLSKEDAHNSSGNYGLLDQIAALQWVQKNIAAFGGDPSRVTIFGQSAGATSILWLMASPLTDGLFQRAIAQSPYESVVFADIRENKYGVEPKEKMGERLAKDLGCDTAADPIACMRSKSAEEVLLAGTPPTDVLAGGYKYEPCVDGWLATDIPLNVFKAGKQQDVPLLIGSMADEWALFQLLAKPTADAYKKNINNIFGDKAEQVLTMYPAGDDNEAKVSEEEVFTLFIFACPGKTYAASMNKAGSKAYLYHFTRVPPGSKILGAFHLLDIGYVFNNFRPFLSPLKADKYFDDTDRALSDTIMSYWVNFAATGDPNGDGLTEWPVYDAATGQYLDLGSTIQVKSGLYDEACDLFINTFEDLRGQ